MHGLTPIVLCLVLAGCAEIRAQLVFEKNHLDVQAPVDAIQTEAIFPFHVEGNRAVTITGIKSSCECTEGRSDRMFYQPGEKGEIRAVFRHGERVGEQFKTLSIRTDEVGVGPQKLSFKVVIPRVVEVMPVALFWEIGAPKESKEIQIVFPDGNFRPVDVQVSEGLKNFDVGLQCLEPGKKYVLAVTPRSTSEPWKEEISVKMDFGGDRGSRRQVCYVYVK